MVSGFLLHELTLFAELVDVHALLFHLAFQSAYLLSINPSYETFICTTGKQLVCKVAGVKGDSNQKSLYQHKKGLLICTKRTKTPSWSDNRFKCYAQKTNLSGLHASLSYLVYSRHFYEGSHLRIHGILYLSNPLIILEFVVKKCVVMVRTGGVEYTCALPGSCEGVRECRLPWSAASSGCFGRPAG